MPDALPSVPAELPPAGPGWARPSVLGLLAVLVAGAGVVVFRGCVIRPSPINSGDKSAAADADPWAGVLSELRRAPDLNGARATLDRLGTALALNPDQNLKPAGLAPEADAFLRKVAGLTDAEIAEIRPAAYSGLDPHYLAECVYLRDAARGIEVDGLEPLRKAELAFAWTGRQVTDRVWVGLDDRGRPTPMPPVPPSAVLTRGSGTGLERATVFLGLLQQLGLDGCFVGPPEAATRAGSYGRDPAAPPTGPFWAVGVRVGADVYLFDPQRGEPVPGPGGKGVGTLAQVRASPDQLKPWRDDKANPWTVPAADVSSASAFLAVPLSGFAPRFVRLERELKADAPPVRLAVDLSALRQRFAAEAKLADLPVWNPAGELFTYPRVLASFVPSKDGGYSPIPDLPTRVFVSAVPPGLVPANSIVGAVERLRAAAFDRYVSAFVAPPAPRERLARGAFTETVPALVAKLKDFQAAQERLRVNRAFNSETGLAFLAASRVVDAKKRLARDKERDVPGPLTAEAAQAETDLYKQNAIVAEALIDQAVADTGAAEATFLLARAMYEQAERAQTRADRPGAKPADRDAAVQAWKESAGWWEQYQPYAADQDRIYPGRAAAAARQTGRANALAGR